MALTFISALLLMDTAAIMTRVLRPVMKRPNPILAGVLGSLPRLPSQVKSGMTTNSESTTTKKGLSDWKSSVLISFAGSSMVGHWSFGRVSRYLL